MTDPDVTAAAGIGGEVLTFPMAEFARRLGIERMITDVWCDAEMTQVTVTLEPGRTETGYIREQPEDR